jgi:hypothetical protein
MLDENPMIRFRVRDRSAVHEGQPQLGMLHGDPLGPRGDLDIR